MRRIELYDDGIGHVELVDSLGTDKTVVNSARVSFGVHKDVLDERDRKLIKYLVEHRHTSTLEHCLATFRFTVPLYVRSQHHRHRTWSYNEISRRYTDSNIEFYEPTAFRTQHKSNRQASNENELINPYVGFLWDDCCPLEDTREYSAVRAMKELHQGAIYLYRDMIEAGVCREQARGVLPQNMYTEYYGTVNLNNLLKFIDLRTHPGAQWEIQRVAEACLAIAKELWPITVGAWLECHGFQEIKKLT